MPPIGQRTIEEDEDLALKRAARETDGNNMNEFDEEWFSETKKEMTNISSAVTKIEPWAEDGRGADLLDQMFTYIEEPWRKLKVIEVPPHAPPSAPRAPGMSL